MSRPLALACVFLPLVCLWGLLAKPPGMVAPFIWLGALWLPGAALSLPPSVPRPRRFDALWIPLGTGPVVFGGGICLGRVVGIPLDLAAFGTVLLGAGALGWRLWRGRGRATPSTEPGLSPPRDRSWILPFVFGLAIIALGSWPPLSHEPLRLRDDALLHLPVIQRVLAGSFPPENPFLAGAPLAYFWFYHVTLAGVARLSALPLDWLPTLFNIHALVLILLALDRVGQRLGLSPVGRAGTIALFGLGLTPWGWIRFWILQATHPELNWALVRASGVSALFPLLSPVDPRLVASLTKVAISNALPMSLALVALAAFPGPPETPLVRVRRTVLIAGCLLFHLATGMFLVLGLGVRWLWARLQRGRETGAEGSLANLGVLVVAVAVAAPYVATVVQARSGSAATWPWPVGRALLLHLSLIGLWLLALPALWRWRRHALAHLWLLTGIPAFLLPFALHLVDGNEYKAYFFLLVLLAPAAGAGLAWVVRDRVALLALSLLLFLPTPYLAARAYVQETPPGTLRAEERHALRESTRSLPPDAVLWTPKAGRGYFRLTEPLGRPLYLSDPYALQIMGQWAGEEARWRRGSLNLVQEEKGAQALAAAQSRLPDRPIYVLLTGNDLRHFPHLLETLGRGGATVVAQSPLHTIYALSPP